jgi:hypothetical protein
MTLSNSRPTLSELFDIKLELGVEEQKEVTFIPTDKPVSALFRHCLTIYKWMDNEAEDRTEGRVYEGSLSTLFVNVGLGQAYYPQVMGRLKKMGCVEMVRRGGGPSPSQWILHKRPTEALFEAVKQQRTKNQQAPARTELEQRQRDMHHRLTALETWARNQGANL